MNRKILGLSVLAVAVAVGASLNVGIAQPPDPPVPSECVKVDSDASAKAFICMNTFKDRTKCVATYFVGQRQPSQVTCKFGS